MPARVTIYDLSGDKPVALERYSVDAKEIVRGDPKRYSFKLPAAEKTDAAKLQK